MIFLSLEIRVKEKRYLLIAFYFINFNTHTHIKKHHRKKKNSIEIAECVNELTRIIIIYFPMDCVVFFFLLLFLRQYLQRFVLKIDRKKQKKKRHHSYTHYQFQYRIE